MNTKSRFGLYAKGAILAVMLIAAPALQAQQSRGTALPSADEILTKYEAFLGGTAALSRATTRILTTRRIVDIGEPSDHILVRRSKKPMYSIMNHAALDGAFIRWQNGCDGTAGWGRADENGVPGPYEESTGGICEQESYYYGYLPLDLARMKGNVQRFEVEERLRIVPTDPGSFGELAGGEGPDLIPPGARDVYLVLSVPRNNDSYAWLYFDVETGALLRRAAAGNGSAPVEPGSNPRITDFIQYREVGDGTRAPFQFVTMGRNSRVRGVHESIVDNTPIDDDVFIMPRTVRREDKGL